MNYSAGLAVDKRGNILVADQWNNRPLMLEQCLQSAFPIFKVSRLVRVHTDSHHNGHNEMIFAVSYV